MKKSLFIFVISLFIYSTGISQSLKAGFDKEEYKQMMYISACSVKDTAYSNKFPVPNYKMIYQSGDIGLDNSWDLWQDERGVGVISLRGTTAKPESWLENFYAAMVPAKGKMQISTDGKTFEYQLAQNPRAAVHVGWLIGLAFLSEEIIPKINESYKNGTKEFIIIGHSQGGGIAYLLTAHVLNLQKLNKLPKDIIFKTYCSAGPKPGNLYFAYDYEAMTQNGWAYNVINSADWVPEVPISIQTLKDFNNTNPFMHAETIIDQQKIPTKQVFNHVYKKLNKPTKKAQENYEKYLGTLMSKIIFKQIEGLQIPEYYSSNNYVRTGTSIILLADEDYFKKFPENPALIFNHHFHEPYLFLTEKLNKAFYE